MVTASVASVLHIGEPKPIVFSEADWNEQSINEIETKGADASRMHMYMASKTYAEKGWYILQSQ